MGNEGEKLLETEKIAIKKIHHKLQFAMQNFRK